jgi:hypothetical protein
MTTRDASAAEVASARRAASRLWAAVGGTADLIERLTFHSGGALPSKFLVTDLASGSWAAAALAVAELVGGAAVDQPVQIDRRLASMWFKWSLRPNGWRLPGASEPVSGDYATVDGWIRLHANGSAHRAAALSVLGTPEEKEAIVARIATLEARDLETAVVGAGGCAAEMRSLAAWSEHPQGVAVAQEPLVHGRPLDTAPRRKWSPRPERPLAGLRVLDLTRILAGPMATRFLAGYGAEVLRIDPPDWDEGLVIPEVSVGKRCARLDLRSSEGRDAFLELLKGADILVHGYRASALERLGLGDNVRREIAPGLIDVRLNAYGWTGPWADRRGFDSLVQMSAGIADAGMVWQQADRPKPLPVQALDHATGYLMAAAAVRGVIQRQRQGHGSEWRVSLARTAHELVGLGLQASAGPLAAETDDDLQPEMEITPWGEARRLRPPVAIAGAPMRWAHGARALGSDLAEWNETVALASG